MASSLNNILKTVDNISSLDRWTQNRELTHNPLSYYTLIQDRLNFIRSGTRKGSEFNYYDNPSKLYFKIMFYFWNSDSELGSSYTGLLAPSWLKRTDANYEASDEEWEKQSQPNSIENQITQYWRYNSAWGYLMNNNELERAELLKQFISLLSNISSESPWYFQEVSGLADALKRDMPVSFKEERKKITIKCLPDAVDNRIATLMDLYRAIVWSWQNKCEVLPANLRKFDMGIFIYSTPIKPMHHMLPKDPNSKERFAHISSSSEGYQTSYKYIEFHNCEFVYNSPGLDTLKNDNGFSPEYSISIEFDDCYEQRYNEFMFRYIGDMIEWDALQSTADMTSFRKNTYSTGEIKDIEKQLEESKKMLETDVNELILATVNNEDDKESREKYEKMHKDNDARTKKSKIGDVERWIDNAEEEIEGTAKRWVNTKIASIVLGNTNTYSIPRIAEQLTGLQTGRILETADAVKSYTEKNSRKTLSFEGVGNGKKVRKKFDDYTGQVLGNLYRANTIANNL